MKPTRSALVLCLAGLVLAACASAPRDSAEGGGPAAPQPAVREPAAAPEAGDKVLWDSWYTVTVNKKNHYGYYNDKVFERGGRVTFQNHFWKSEEGFINEEQLGAIAENNAELTPVFFNFRSSYRSVETNIDGSVGAKLQLTVKAKSGGKERQPIIRTLPKGLFVSSMFPLWIARQLPSLKPGQSRNFMTLLEDNLELAYRNIPGTATVEQPDEIARRTKTSKVTVSYLDRKSTWWIEPSGNAVRIEMPAQKIVVERVPREQAKAFLSE